MGNKAFREGAVVKDRAEPFMPASQGPGDCSKRLFVFCAIAIMIVSCLLNLGALNQSEVIDDHELLHYSLSRGCGRNPVDCFRHPQFGLYYRPLFGASFSVGENLHGQMPFWFHVENLLLHGVVVLQACWIFRLLLGRNRAALLAAVLFAVHPLQVPATTFIGGRTDTLALFCLFWFMIGALKAQSSRRVWAWRILAVLGYSAAIFAKEQCIPVVVLLPLLTAIGHREARRPDYIRMVGWMMVFVLPIVGFLLAARHVIPPGAVDYVAWKADKTHVAWDPGLRLEMVGRTLWYYTALFLWPVPHVIHRSTLGPWDPSQPLVALAGFFSAGLWLAATLHSWPVRAHRLLALWVILTLAPCINIVPIPSQFVGCYRGVIPLFGVAGCAGILLDAIIRAATGVRWWLAAVLAPAVLGGIFSGLSLADVTMWQSDLALSLEEFRADPNFLPALAGYGVSLRYNGRLNEALATDDKVVARLFPVEKTLDERERAIDTPQMLRSVKSQSSLRYKLRPFIDYVMRERGGARQEAGLYLSAIEDYQLTLAAMPDDDEVADALVYCCQISGRYDEARIALEKLVSQVPTAARLHRLGVIYYHQYRWLEANQTLARALAFSLREHTQEYKSILSLYEKTVSPARSERERMKQYLWRVNRPTATKP